MFSLLERQGSRTVPKGSKVPTYGVDMVSILGIVVAAFGICSVWTLREFQVGKHQVGTLTGGLYKPHA